MEKSSRVKVIFTDIDGVWTDGSMYYDQQANEFKRFCTYDGGGVYYAHVFGLKVGIITGEKTKIVENRAKKVKADYCFQGVTNKLKILNKFCLDEGLCLNEIAYIGDDVLDVPILKSGVYSACPANAFDYVKKVCDVVLQKKGGEGVFREFVELIITSKYHTTDLLGALDIISKKNL